MTFSDQLPKTEILITILCLALIVGIPQYGVIGAFVLVFAYIRRSKERSTLLTSIGFRKPHSGIKVLLTTLLLGIAIELFAEIIFNPLAEKIVGAPIDLTRVDFQGSILVYLVWVIIGFVLGGLLEEVLFRGFLLTRVAKLFANADAGKVFGLVTTSVVFGLCHLYQGWGGVLSTGFIGLLLGSVFLLSGKNLWYVILTHGFINLASITILYLNYYDSLKSLVF
ncbi:CPBP family intramembrane glutamic endopeptidase [Hymenobacter sp. BT491]|uniref:CPBP family intramembrane glutamic endopeptidase n=1 Tax=Hymenobacter sp. BT491 TaxID=2766779 RepID=UPI0016534417|nr:type II CAAX endopeptidase family protein [Hymenobacter sp. BT491]MBC6989270.1 CPBP family intramembrane metalloprotease [Hymenobacter sp. BT491]